MLKIILIINLLIFQNILINDYVNAMGRGGKTMESDSKKNNNIKKIIEIESKPIFRREEQRHIHLMNAEGLQRDQVYTYLDFEYNSKVYSTWWSSVTSPAPVTLFTDITYKFIIQLSPEDRENSNYMTCDIIEIWDAKKLIWKNPEFENKSKKK